MLIEITVERFRFPLSTGSSNALYHPSVAILGIWLSQAFDLEIHRLCQAFEDILPNFRLASTEMRHGVVLRVTERKDGNTTSSSTSEYPSTLCPGKRLQQGLSL